MDHLKERLVALSNNLEFRKLVQNKPLTKEQLVDNLYLIQEILDERKMLGESLMVPTFAIGSDGYLYKIYEKSEEGVKKEFLENIKTQHITKINVSIDLSDIKQTKERSNIGLALEHITKNPSKSTVKGLYLYGAVGVGKTFISEALANWYAKKGHSVGYVNVSELMSYLKQSFSSSDSSDTSSITELLKNVEILFIDDIGAETIADWFRDEIFFSILSSRMNNQMPTFFSSNYDFEKLEKIESFSPKQNIYAKDKASRLIERIKALSNAIKIEGKNYRY